MTCKPSGPKGRMVPQVHVTRKPSDPTGRIEMEKGVVGSHKSDGEGSTITSDTQAIESHRSDGHGDRPHRFGFHRLDGKRVPQVHVAWRKDRKETFMMNCNRHG